MRRLLAFPLLLLFAGSASAQTIPSVALGVDIGPAIPLGEFADDGAKVGWAAGASAALRLTRHLGAYVSAERASFGVDESAGNPGDGTWTDTGVGVGARLWFPVREDARTHPWVQLGLGWHNVDKPIAGPQFANLNTDRIRTIEGGAGLDIALTRRVLFLRPTARYRRYSFSVETPTETLRTRISSLSVGIGLVVVLGLGDNSDRGPDGRLRP
jgi:hypothetical protein